jgi:outer membrane protein TolC
MRRPLSLVILSALAAGALVMPLPASAQGEGTRLGLADVVLLARDNSLAVQRSRQQLEGTVANRQVTVGNALPSVSVQTSANYQELPPGLGSLFGGSGSGGGIVGFPAQGVTVDTTLSAQQVVFDAFATRDALAIADLQTDISRYAIHQAEQEAMATAAVAYFNLLGAGDRAQVAESTVKQAQELLRLGQLRLKAGTGTQAEVLQLRAQLAIAQGTLAQARNGVNVGRLSLANAVNAPVSDQQLDENPRVPTLTVAPERDLGASLDRRPEIQQLKLQEQINSTRVSLESRALWPNLAAVSRYSMRGLNQGQFLAGLNLNWNVFDGFKVRNRMEVAKNDAEASRLQLEQTRQTIALDIRQQYQTREEARIRVATAREGLSAAQEAYRLAARRFQLGLSASYEVTDVQTTLIQSSTNYVQARNDLRVAEIRLARAMGYDLAGYLAGQPSQPAAPAKGT